LCVPKATHRHQSLKNGKKKKSRPKAAKGHNILDKKSEIQVE